MVKHTQTIRGQQTADELFECVWPFCGLGVSRVNQFENRPNIIFS